MNSFHPGHPHPSDGFEAWFPKFIAMNAEVGASASKVGQACLQLDKMMKIQVSSLLGHVDKEGKENIF